MLAHSVMWCACLMACVTSSFMLCISYQWKRACVSVLLRRGGINTKTELNSSPPNMYHLKQRSTHMQSAEKQMTRLSLEKNPFHNTLPCSLFIFHLLIFCSTFTQNPLLPKWIHPQRTHFLSSQLSVNISDTAPDISHTSPFIPPFLFFFLTQTA